jgi:hypothetical protein
MKLKLLVGLALLGSLGTAHAESLPEVQSRCAKDAATFWARQKETTTMSDRAYYENHYSEAKKSCFMLIIDEYDPPVGKPSLKPPPNMVIVTHYTLWDVYENRRLGTLRVFDGYATEGMSVPDMNRPGLFNCYFDGVECSGKDEFRAKVQAYIPGWKG